MNMRNLRGTIGPLSLLSFLAVSFGLASIADAQRAPGPRTIVHKVQGASERLEMTVQTSRRLELEKKIPEAQVNNPDILDLTPLAPNVIQISAKRTGVTQVNLWDEEGKLYTIDVIVHPDAQELTITLETQFPNAALKVVPVGESVLISGYVDHPEEAECIVRIAQEFYPEVINHIQISGVQQVLLHVKVMEVSRTKLRTMGFDFAHISNLDPRTMVRSGVSGLLGWDNEQGLIFSGNETATFGIVDGSSSFLGVLEALRKDDLVKILAEPTLVTVSGRPARFISGGEQPVPVPQALGTTTIQYKPWGTIVDFVPVVLGNGRIRLEIRAKVSEPDASQTIVVNNQTVIGYRTREIDTGVEMRAGQTLAIAGLVQSRVESENKGIPWLSELPYIGVPFRRVKEEYNEIELVIMVTPELVDGMDADEAPECGPGTRTTSPNDWDLFMKGHLEVPNCCPDGQKDGCVKCASHQGQAYQSQPDPVLLREQGDRPVFDSREILIEPAGSVPNRSATSNNRRIPPNRKTRPEVFPADGPNEEPGFIGPIGYDVLK